MAVVSDKKWAGSKVTYHAAKHDSALANAGTIAVDHAEDSEKTRDVKVIDMATGSPVADPTDYTVAYTDNNTTTVTNASGGTVNWKVIVSVNP